MLVQLDIRNFALIDRTSLRVADGLTAFTGETGAGKSIVFDALGLLLGARASSEVIRAGCDDASVAAIFDVREPAAGAVGALLSEAGIANGGELILRRSISRTGPNRCYVNDQTVTVSLLGQITAELVELVGQHEHLALLRTGAQRQILDRFGVLELPVQAMRSAWNTLNAANEKLAALKNAGRDRTERIAMLRFQASELDVLGPKAGEYEDLERRLVRARNAGKLQEAAAVTLGALSDGHVSATDLLRKASEALHRAARFDDPSAAFVSRLDELLVLADDLSRDLARHFSDFGDASDLDSLEARHEQLRRAMRRFGLDAEELVSRSATIRAELLTLEDFDGQVELAERAVQRARAAALEAARELSAARREAATRLFAVAASLLGELGMPHARLELAAIDESEARLGPWGFDGIEMLLSANPGQPPGPMRKIASGGELSRILLAVKIALADTDPVETYVFDEVDSGIGGAAARVVGRMLRRLGADRQVLCVTHLAQIAASATNQFAVEKRVVDGQTYSQLTELAEEARIEELARMLGGDRSATSLAHARELVSESGRHAPG